MLFTYGFFIFLLLYLILVYRNLLSLNQRLSTAWLNIDRLLLQRHKLTMLLLAGCSKHMSFEKPLLEKVRQQSYLLQEALHRENMELLHALQEKLDGSLHSLRNRMPLYQQLQHDREVQQLFNRIDARQSALIDTWFIFMRAMDEKNQQTERFPYSLLAKAPGFEKPFYLHSASTNQVSLS